MRQWIAVGAAIGLVIVSLPYVREHTENISEDLSREAPPQGAPTVHRLVTPPPLSHIDLTQIDASGEVSTAPAHGERVAELTLDSHYQRAAKRMLREGKVPEASIVMTDVKTGEVLVWANHAEDGPLRDFASEATAPSASVFKIVTGAGLMEQGLRPRTKVCYRGGKSRLTENDLVPDERRDKWCATMSEALGRSLNTVFARMANEHLTREQLTDVAGRLGWDTEVPFDVPVSMSRLDLPEDDFGLAKTAAGFWNTTLSPFQAVNLATTIANQGEMVRLSIVRRVQDEDGDLYQASGERQVYRRVLNERTADMVRVMMENTVHNGTGYKSFHDRAGRPYLPKIRVAGKTGTLMRPKPEGPLYTWFVGFAPSDAPEVAISVLASNRPAWRVKATTLAAKMLRVYFADKGRKGVRHPYKKRAKRD